MWEKFPNAVGSPYVPTVAPTANGSLSVAMVANGTNQSTLDACFKVTPYWGNMFRPMDDPDYPWLGLWTTLPILEVWYWCTDQVFAWQHILFCCQGATVINVATTLLMVFCQMYTSDNSGSDTKEQVQTQLKQKTFCSKFSF